MGKKKSKSEPGEGLTEFNVNVSAWISKNVTVHAKTPQEAKQLGLDAAGFSLCHQCSSEGDVGDPARVVVLDASQTVELLDEEP